MSYDDSSNLPAGKSGGIALYRERLAVTLTKSARSLAFNMDSKRTVHQTAGIRPQFKDRLFGFIFVLNFLFVLVGTIVAGSIYLLFMQSDQFMSESRFVVRSAQSVVSNKNGAKPSAKIAQDTQVITSFLTTSEMLTALKERVNFKSIFGRDDIDILSRLDLADPLEDQVSYWESHVESKIDPSSGIVTVKVRAFSPAEAQYVLDTVVEIAEERVNKLNSGIWAELISTAKADFGQAQQRLEDIRQKIQQKQLESGIFSVDTAVESSSDIIKTVQEELLKLESRLAVLTSQGDAINPIAVQLKQTIAVRKDQINTLQQQIAGRTNAGKSLSEASLEFSQLDLEKLLAEERFATSLRELKRVELLGSMQLVYLDRFMAPTLPQEKAGLSKPVALLSLILLALLAWALITGGLFLLRQATDR